MGSVPSEAPADVAARAAAAGCPVHYGPSGGPGTPGGPRPLPGDASVSDYEKYMRVSHDKGITWTDAVQLNAPGTTAWFPWVAAGGAGRLVVTWYQNDQGLPRQAGGQVYVMAAVSLDADFPQPRFTVMRADANPVHVGPECRETPGACTRSLLDFFEVGIHPDGFAFLAYATDTYQVPRDTVKTVRMSAGPDLWG